MTSPTTQKSWTYAELIQSTEEHITVCLENAKMSLDMKDMHTFKSHSDNAFGAYMLWTKLAFNVEGDTRLKPLINRFRSMKSDFRAKHGYCQS